MALQTSTIVIAAMVPLILWRLYARYRRLVGRQRSRLWRHWSAAIFFPLFAVLLAVPIVMRPLSLGALALGLAAGAALAVAGLKSTRYEATPGGFYFTPNARIGIALSLLMIARIAYRLLQMGSLTPAAHPGQVQDFARSPLTLVVVGLVLAYYAAYAVGLIRWRSRTMAEAVPPGEAP